ncbi:AbrB/MazE/SpoVT family DNA-binding domain-containing protein [Candidatus Woesearchaeota archaeon]|nr:AbrB/MazE/SpoVT family DNA-binding domain-containing protein [Candidatus Woesearchaeota archaeon]
MKRKLVQHGNTSLTVSLPKKWTDKFNLKKGDEIEIVEKDDKLFLYLQTGNISENPFKKGVLDVSKTGVLTRRSFDAMYKAGYDEIEVIYTHPEQLKDVKTAIDNEAMAFEIVRQEKNKCVVRSISEADPKEFDSLLRRTLLLLKVMGEDLLTALKNNDYNTISTIKDLEKTNNKFTHFCRRALVKNGYKEYNKTVFMYTIVEQLEKCADEFKFLCDFLTGDENKRYEENKKQGENKKLKISTDTFLLFEDVNKSIAMFNDLFFNFSMEKAKEFGAQRKKVMKEGFELLKKKKDNEKVVVHYLINIESMVFEMFGPYMALVL